MLLQTPARVAAHLKVLSGSVISSRTNWATLRHPRPQTDPAAEPLDRLIHIAARRPD